MAYNGRYMKTNILVGLILCVLVVLGGVGYVLLQPSTVDTPAPTPTEPAATPTTTIEDLDTNLLPEPIESVPAALPATTVIGESVAGNPITAHHFGTGETNLLFVGGLHGGYSYNTTLVAYELIDYLAGNPAATPGNLRITIIPVVNPDGLAETVGSTGRFNPTTAPTEETDRTAGRFNGNDVDLNRNFDCEWQASGVWRTTTVSGGTSPTSEPETAALAAFVRELDPAAAVVWFGAEGRVYPSACGTTPSRAAVTLAATYATAAGYAAAAEFDAYPVTGDFVNWLAKEGIPAISVLLTNHTNPEWEKNQAGVTAVLNQFAE